MGSILFPRITLQIYNTALKKRCNDVMFLSMYWAIILILVICCVQYQGTGDKYFSLFSSNISSYNLEIIQLIYKCFWVESIFVCIYKLALNFLNTFSISKLYPHQRDYRTKGQLEDAVASSWPPLSIIRNHLVTFPESIVLRLFLYTFNKLLYQSMTTNIHLVSLV